MKKFYMTLVAMLCGVAAMAQDVDGVYANDITVDKGVTEASLEVCLKNSMEVAAISFRLALPDGVTMALNKKGKRYVEIDEDRMDEHKADIADASDGNVQIAIYDKNPFYENDGVVVTVPLAISEDVAAVDGTYEIKLYEISAATPDGTSLTVSGVMPTEATCTLTVGKGNGINSINAADSKAPVYNVAGQRVSKTQKGVYIQNGKKIAVK
jgi:hypothetical protein